MPRPIHAPALAALAAVFAVPAAAADQVVIDLAGVRVQNGRNETRSSAPNALTPGWLFRSRVDAMVRGRGLVLGLLYGTPEPLGQVLEELAPGSSAVLDQTVPNFPGTFPQAVSGQRIEGTTVISGINVNYGLTVAAQIDAAGVAAFSFTDVVLTPTTLGYFEVSSGNVALTRVPGVLAGSIDPDGFGGDVAARAAGGGAVVLRDAGGATLETAPVYLDPEGRWVAAFAYRGEAEAVLRLPGWLGRSLGRVTIGENQQGGFVAALVNGDVDGDDAVTVFDYDRLSTAFDATPADPAWDAAADLDGDGAVSVFDYDILSRNFDRVGD